MIDSEPTQSFLAIVGALRNSQLQENIHLVQNAIAENANSIDQLFKLGIACAEDKRFNDALLIFNEITSYKKNDVLFFYNLGLIHSHLCNHQFAVETYKRALTIKPNDADTLVNLGCSLVDLNSYEDALMILDEVIKMNPMIPEAWSNRAISLNNLDRLKEAVESYEKAYLINPTLEYLVGDLAFSKMKVFDLTDFEHLSNLIIRDIQNQLPSAKPFTSLALVDSPAIQMQCAKSWIDDKHPLKNALPPIEKKRHNKIRVGYFSADFKSHPLAFLTAELFELHDRSQFEIYAFALKKAPDGDEMRPRLMKAFDHFLEVENLSDLEVAKLARELEIDIAVDLGGHTQFAPTGIMSYRAAPIQVNYLGYAGTMGAEYMDYIIADRTVIPESSQKYYSEKVVYLPNSFMVDDSKRVASDRIFTRQECGLPENTFVFCCFNNSYKFNKRILESWSRVLLKVENSVLWLSENNEYFRDNIKTEFKNLGVDPNRIIFAQRVDSMADHLARYKLADLFLDTHPYNAHTTAIDALKAGVPVITYLGQAFPGRVAASLLNAVGLPQLIAMTISEYETIAVNLSLNVQKLLEIKKILVKNLACCPIFESSITTLQLEYVFREIYY